MTTNNNKFEPFNTGKLNVTIPDAKLDLYDGEEAAGNLQLDGAADQGLAIASMPTGPGISKMDLTKFGADINTVADDQGK